MFITVLHIALPVSHVCCNLWQKQACIIQLLDAKLFLESLLYSSYIVMQRSRCIADNAACVSLTANFDISVRID